MALARAAATSGRQQPAIGPVSLFSATPKMFSGLSRAFLAEFSTFFLTSTFRVGAQCAFGHEFEDPGAVLKLVGLVCSRVVSRAIIPHPPQEFE